MQVGEPAAKAASQGNKEQQAQSKRYRIRLHWGDFSALFSGTLKTVRGRQERMMALGYYYGDIDGKDGPVTRRCWKYMREEMEAASKKSFTDDAFRSHVTKQLKTIVQKVNHNGQHETNPEKDACIVFPGSFCFKAISDLGNPISAKRFDAEKAAWQANQGLGRIPLLVDVVDRDTGKRAEGVRIVFELIPAFANDADQVKREDALSNVTELTQSPRTFVTGKLSKDAALQPFGYNCVTNDGGRKIADVYSKLIASGKVHGFPHSAVSADRPNKFSVVVSTDEKGTAGVVLLPPRTAGDCIKLRVYVHPHRGTVSLPPDAQEKKETGRLTVWRQLRLAKIIVKPPASAYSSLPPVPASLQGALGTISTATMQAEYAKAFHILVVDKEAATPKILDAATYSAAITAVRRTLPNPQSYDLQTLIRTNFQSPFMFWIEDDGIYNANRRSGTAALNLNSAAVWNVHLRNLVDQLVDAFCKHFTDNAVPGVVVLRSQVGDSYSYWPNPAKPAGFFPYTTSGVATRMRGCFLFYPNSSYASPFPYPLTINAMHEMGHVLYLRHHYTGGTVAAPNGGFPTNHDSQDLCLMGYLALTTNDYCGKCILKLRGWDETKI